LHIPNNEMKSYKFNEDMIMNQSAIAIN